MKPRDSNSVLPEHTNDLGWDKNLIRSGSAAEKNSYCVVGATTPSYWGYQDNNLHMRFNEVEDFEKSTLKPMDIWTHFQEGDNNHLRFNEVGNEDDEDVKFGSSEDLYTDNGIAWAPFGDNALDYPNNQAKSKVETHTFACFALGTLGLVCLVLIQT